MPSRSAVRAISWTHPDRKLTYGGAIERALDRLAFASTRDLDARLQLRGVKESHRG